MQAGVEKVSTMDTKKVDETNKKYIRLHFTFTKQKFNGSKEDYFKQTVYEIMQCAKEIDMSAGLMTWEVGKGKIMNGNEVQLMSFGKKIDYLDLPKTIGNYNDSETYYGNGVRITTTMVIDEFVSHWN